MEKVLTALLVTLSLLSLSNETRLPACWRAKIAQLCEQFENVQSTLPTVTGTCYLQFVQESIQDPILILFPPVILWSPLEQFQNCLQASAISCPKCDPEQDNVPLLPTGWCNGAQGDRSEPRKVYGTDGVTLLVGRVYKCLKGHEINSYHPSILQQFPKCLIPFRLWHKTGFTTDFIDWVVALITAGMSLNGIRDFYFKKQISLYYNRKIKHAHLMSNGSAVTFPSLDTWKQSFNSFVPSVHAISGCFLADFWGKDTTYTKNMQSTTIDQGSPWLSLDHTFSSTSKYSID